MGHLATTRVEGHRLLVVGGGEGLSTCDRLMMGLQAAAEATCESQVRGGALASRCALLEVRQLSQE